MFAKLKENKFFKLLSNTLCSIELIEMQDKISASRPCLHLQPRSLVESDATPVSPCKKRENGENTHHNHRLGADL